MFSRNAYSRMNTVGMCAMQSGGAADTLIATTAVDKIQNVFSHVRQKC